jgi:hypothetical protein
MIEQTKMKSHVGDSAIMPSVTVQIPMPPGAATPAQSPVQPTQTSSPATPDRR